MQSIVPETLLSLQTDPPELEALYRERPAAFTDALAVALDRQPESVALQVWAARLDAELGTPVPRGAATGWVWAEGLTPERARRLVWITIGLIAAAGLWAKWPQIAGWPTYDSAGPDFDYQRDDRFYGRFVPFMAVGPLLALFVLRYRTPRRLVLALAGAAVALLAVQGVRPIDTDAGWLSAMHVPLLLLSLGGVAAMGARWRDPEARVGYLQLVSETAAFAALLLLGGVVLVGLTAALFSAIGVDVEAMFEWVVPFGLLGVLPVGALVAGQRAEAGRVAPLVARVFGPMALAVLVVYLPTLLASGGLADRDSLLALNVALVAVLALVILMQAERPDVPRHWTDVVAFALVAVALVADAAALASIAGRLAGGLTPNRLAIVGLNALVLVHFVGLVVPLGRRALGRGTWPGDAWTARFLSVYAVWGATVVLLFPLLF